MVDASRTSACVYLAEDTLFVFFFVLSFAVIHTHTNTHTREHLQQFYRKELQCQTVSMFQSLKVIIFQSCVVVVAVDVITQYFFVCSFRYSHTV